jgi:diguanylate cyclase (GGDEF)-like protein
LVGLELADLDETIALRRAGGAAAAAPALTRQAGRSAQDTNVARGQPYMEELRRIVGAETARGLRERERRRDQLLALSDRACLLSAVATLTSMGVLGGVLLFALRTLRARRDQVGALEAETSTLGSAVERSERRNRELRLVADMLRAVAASPAVRDAGPAIARCFGALLPGTAGAAFLLRDGEDAPIRLAIWGLMSGAGLEDGRASHAWSQACPTLRHGVFDAAAAGYGKLFCVHDTRRDGTSVPGRVCIPLVTQDGLVGSLHIDDLAVESPRRAAQEHLAQWAAEQLALALGHARERETLRRQAVQDPLTGLFNRRYFDEAVNRELSRARRKALPTSLVVLDIDNFKRVNDTYGHGAGDRVLRAIARQIHNAIREGDIACRYGGEELVILMPECPADTAAERAEELRAAIEACISEAGGNGPSRITASFGVAEFPAHGHDAESLFQAADKAMYRAKHQGRNQVVAAG